MLIHLPLGPPEVFHQLPSALKSPPDLCFRAEDPVSPAYCNPPEWSLLAYPACPVHSHCLDTAHWGGGRGSRGDSGYRRAVEMLGLRAWLVAAGQGGPTTHKRNVWCFLSTVHLILRATGWTWVILKREIADSDWSVRKSPLSRGPGTGWGWAWENAGATSLVGRGSERSQGPVRLRTGHLLKSTPSGQSFLWDQVPLFPY